MADNNQYISKYLIHWAGRSKSDVERVQILSSIVTQCRLLLSDNYFYLDGDTKIEDKMACLTDVPLPLSSEHCEKYSNFGIAFNKLEIMNKGAQPVFYYSHKYKRDIKAIYKFLFDQLNNPTIDRGVLRSLHRHFYFMQEFSEGKADGTDTNYYEREWRVGELCLKPQGDVHWCLENNMPNVGESIVENGESFFLFDNEDVAFLIVPKSYVGMVLNPRNFQIRTYVDLVN